MAAEASPKQAWVRHWDLSELHPVPGIAGTWNRFIDASPENGGLIAGLGRLAPGEAMGYHAHHESEVFFILEGEGEARWKIGDEEHSAALMPGVAFYKVGGIPHTMINTGATDLVGFVAKVGFKSG
jgi:mannose-6-phosphate isomerase-like protein (cupin superfamily)